jgi:anaphase-promoting complex subunit 3
MDSELSPSFLPVLSQRFQSLVWSCIDSDLNRSAVFFAERYFALNQDCHDARHLYATTLLREWQSHSALSLVNISREKQCAGCLELKARCATALGRYRQAHEALEESMRETPSMSPCKLIRSIFSLFLIRPHSATPTIETISG